MDRPTPTPTDAKATPARDAAATEKDAAGCLVMLGSLALIGAFLVMTAYESEIFRNLLNSLDWTSVTAFFRSAWFWLRGDVDGDHVLQTIVWVFFIAYCAMFSQWVAFLIGRRNAISSRRLWVVSSAYFCAMIVTLGFGISEGTNSFGEWLIYTLFASAIPLSFLTITLALVLDGPRHREPSESE